MERGVSSDDILVAGLIIEPLEEVRDITRTKTQDYKTIDIRGKAAHCVHLVLKGKGLREQGDPDDHYATGLAYGERIGLYPFINRVVQWGGQAGERYYTKLHPPLDKLPSLEDLEIIPITPPLGTQADGFFVEFGNPIELKSLASKIKWTTKDPEALLAFSDGIQVAYEI